jgi:hypothetical protein
LWENIITEAQRPKSLVWMSMPRVDVAINVFGKPYQTAVSLLTLLKHSASHIDKIFFIKEKVQPHGDSVDFVLNLLRGINAVVYEPRFHIGIRAFYPRAALQDTEFRLSVRYQYAWETTDKNHLFILHNDNLFESDVIGAMLARSTGQKVAGVGQIGQCWNCPAYPAGACDGDRFQDFKPTYDEAMRILRSYPSPRTIAERIDRDSPMPFPECRLNEFACLVNLTEIKDQIIPFGDVPPLGAHSLVNASGSPSLDTGTDWFRALMLKGYRFVNYTKGFRHGWAADGHGGHPSDSDRTRYIRHEAIAKEYLERTFALKF